MYHFSFNFIPEIWDIEKWRLYWIGWINRYLLVPPSDFCVVLPQNLVRKKMYFHRQKLIVKYGRLSYTNSWRILKIKGAWEVSAESSGARLQGIHACREAWCLFVNRRCLSRPWVGRKRVRWTFWHSPHTSGRCLLALVLNQLRPYLTLERMYHIVHSVCPANHPAFRLLPCRGCRIK